MAASSIYSILSIGMPLTITLATRFCTLYHNEMVGQLNASSSPACILPVRRLFLIWRPRLLAFFICLTIGLFLGNGLTTGLDWPARLGLKSFSRLFRLSFHLPQSRKWGKWEILEKDMVHVNHAIKTNIHQDFFVNWIIAVQCLLMRLFDIEV